MALARDLGQALQQSLGFPHHQLGNYLVMQPPEQVVIACEITAVEERNGELSVVGVVAVALGQRPRSRTQLQPQVPQFLRKAANGILESLLGVAIGEEKQQIDVGIGEHPSTAESSSGNQ